MGEQGREHVVQNLDYKHIANKMLEITNKKLNLAQEIEPVLNSPLSVKLSK